MMTRKEIKKEIERRVLEEEAQERKKQRLLAHDMDFAFLEELVQKINENPKLKVRITLTDGTVLDLNTAPRTDSTVGLVPHDVFMEVR